jgi:uncharacterized protein affecting Mg2+/Co2+ transport
MNLLVTVGGFVVLVAIVWGIAKAASGNRYANMTEEEFEAEAKRASLVGAGVMGLQKVIDPGHRVEYVEQAQQQVEADSAESGDGPETGPSLSRDEANKK